jgi:predicted transcriptional regulator of viral defense system
MQRVYVNVPLEASEPEHWSADPWAAAGVAFAPGYAGGWTALHHWDLTDQIFSTTVFLTTRLELRHRPDSALFGTRRVWREGIPVHTSDRERT